MSIWEVLAHVQQRSSWFLSIWEVYLAHVQKRSSWFLTRQSVEGEKFYTRLRMPGWSLRLYLSYQVEENRFKDVTELGKTNLLCISITYYRIRWTNLIPKSSEEVSHAVSAVASVLAQICHHLVIHGSTPVACHAHLVCPCLQCSEHRPCHLLLLHTITYILPTTLILLNSV